MKRFKVMALSLFILGSMVPLACGPSLTAPMPPIPTSIDTSTPTPTSTTGASPSATNTPTSTASSTGTNTPTSTPTSTSTIAYPVGTHTIASGVNPPVTFTITNNTGASANFQIAMFTYPDNGKIYQDVGIGPIASGASGSDTITIPASGSYFVYIRAYVSGSYVLYGWAPMTISPGYSITGSIAGSFGTLSGINTTSLCVGCGLP